MTENNPVSSKSRVLKGKLSSDSTGPFNKY